MYYITFSTFKTVYSNYAIILYVLSRRHHSIRLRLLIS
nr:MAG TPA: hypothetical protein [Bacteriophage sp.]